MDPIQEEKQALSQQEEFESRLFAENDYVVIACVPVTKAGVNDRSGVPKQYFLVLTVHKNDNTDCKLHTVRVKNNGLDLVIQKSPKIYKLKWFEIADENNPNSLWDFKLYWKNGSNESFALSPNTLRSVNLFAFIIYNVAVYCSKHEISIKPLELVELEVHGREWLHKIFNNNLLFRRINQIQQDIFTPIYKRLALNNIANNNNNNSNIVDDNGKKRRLSMRNDLPFTNSSGNPQQNRSFDVPLMTNDETENIKKYMAICNVSIDNIHLLEAKLMEKQRDIMRENIYAFQGNEQKLDRLLDNIDNSIQSVQDLQTSLNQYKRHINKMASGVSRIKKKNHSLAIQDQNNTKLTAKLTEICSKLKLHAKYEQTLKNPSFKPDTEYKRSLKAVDTLSTKLNLTFTDGLESMTAVKSQRDHFKTLNERFCSEASNFLNDLFTKNGRIQQSKPETNRPRNKSDKQRFIGPHTPIHAVLFKYDELLKHIGALHADKFKNIIICYERAFSKLYAHEFKSYFNWIKTTISKENETTPKKMANFPTINLSQLIRNDDVEVSQSNASTIFNRQPSTQLTSNSMANMFDGMPTINEDNETKNKITNVYRQCLAETLPVIIIEQQFMETYLFKNSENKTDIERILTSMFSHLENQFIQLIDKADSMNNFNTLEMLIISERTLHSYRDYSSFLAALLSKLHTKLTLNWNAFVSQEIDWIKSQKISIKQAGILLPVAKFPAFCNEMYKVVTFGDEKSKEITDIDTLIPKDALCFVEKNKIKLDEPENINKQESSNPFDNLPDGARASEEIALEKKEEKEEKKSDNNSNAFVVFRESEQVTNTIHKMTTMLFHWLEKAAISDPKYTHVCLMENYHYFYSVFSKTESLRAIREHVAKAKKNYDKARRSYVKWCVRYECKALTEFWDDFEQKSINDIETVSVYISSQKVKTICTEYLDTEKKIKKFVGGMFNRLKKHLGDNDILFSKIWRKITQYFCSKYGKFKGNVDKIYSSNISKKFMKYSMEFVYNQFVDQYRNAFGGQTFDDTSSMDSSSIGASSMASGMTSNSYYSSYTASTKVKVQANMKDKQNKARKGLSSFKRKSKNKLMSNLSTRSNDS